MTKKKTVTKTVKVDKQKEAIKKALKKAEEFLVENGDSIDIEIFDDYINLVSSNITEDFKFPIKENPSIPKADTAIWVQEFGDGPELWLPRVATGKLIDGKIEVYGFENEDEGIAWERWCLYNPTKRK